MNRNPWEYPNAVRDWLAGLEWHTFATLTYRHRDPSQAAARRAVERFLSRSPVELAWWVTERGEKFGRIHNHALIRFRPTLLGAEDAQAEAAAWWRQRNGIADVSTYDPERGAAGYLSSYVTKKVCEYDLWLPGTS